MRRDITKKNAFRPARIAWSLVLTLAAAGAARATPIVYQIQDHSDYQSGFTLSGTITTNGKSGLLAQSDILGWSVTVKKGDVVDTFSDGGYPLTTFGGFNGIFASSSQLYLPDPTRGDQGGVYGISLHDTVNPGSAVNWYRYEFTPNSSYTYLVKGIAYGWRNVSTGLNQFDWVVAVNPAPEPSTLASCAVAGAFLAAGALRRRRRRAGR